MTFRPGQPVVCVNNDSTNACNEKELIKGRIYTVAVAAPPCCEAAVHASVLLRGNSTDCVHLVEVRRSDINRCMFCQTEMPFAASRFRPIQHRETDISELQKLCDPTREVVR